MNDAAQLADGDAPKQGSEVQAAKITDASVAPAPAGSPTPAQAATAGSVIDPAIVHADNSANIEIAANKASDDDKAVVVDDDAKSGTISSSANIIKDDTTSADLPAPSIQPKVAESAIPGLTGAQDLPAEANTINLSGGVDETANAGLTDVAAGTTGAQAQADGADAAAKVLPDRAAQPGAADTLVPDDHPVGLLDSAVPVTAGEVRRAAGGDKTIFINRLDPDAEEDDKIRMTAENAAQAQSVATGIPSTVHDDAILNPVQGQAPPEVQPALSDDAPDSPFPHHYSSLFDVSDTLQDAELLLIAEAEIFHRIVEAGIRAVLNRSGISELDALVVTIPQGPLSRMYQLIHTRTGEVLLKWSGPEIVKASEDADPKVSFVAHEWPANAREAARNTQAVSAKAVAA